MKAGNKRSGFALLEVMAAVMIFMTVASVLLTSASAMHRRAIRKIEKDEAYDTALAAVRLMAYSPAEILTSGNGMAKRETELRITPEDGSEPFSVPVIVWSEWDGTELTLYAESVIGGQSGTASLTLRKRRNGNVREATASDAGDGDWVLVRYGKGKRSEE